MGHEKRPHNENIKLAISVWSTKERNVVAVILVLMLLISALLWMTTQTILTGGVAPSIDAIRWTTILVAFLLYFFLIALAGVSAIIVRSRWIMRGALALLALLPFAWFGFSLPTVIAAILLFVAFWQFDWNVRIETMHRTHFAVLKSLHYGLGFAVSLSLLAISFLFYSAVERSQSSTTTPVDAAVEGASSAVNQILLLQVPSYDPTETVDALLRRLALPQIEKAVRKGAANVTPDSGKNDNKEPSLTNPAQLLDMLGMSGAQAVLQELPQNVRDELASKPQDIETILAGAQEQTVNRALAELRDQLLQEMKVDANGATPIGDIIQQLLDSSLRPKLTPYQHFIPPVLALAMFVILQLFHAVYIPLIIVFAALIVSLLKVCKILHIRTVQQPVEIVSIE